MHNNHHPLVPTLLGSGILLRSTDCIHAVAVVMQTESRQTTKLSKHGSELKHPNPCQPGMSYHAERGNQKRPNPMHNNHHPLVPTLRVVTQTEPRQTTKPSKHVSEPKHPNPCQPGMGYHAERGNQKRPNPIHNNHYPLVPTLRVVMQTKLKKTTKPSKHGMEPKQTKQGPNLGVDFHGCKRVNQYIEELDYAS